MGTCHRGGYPDGLRQRPIAVACRILSRRLESLEGRLSEVESLQGFDADINGSLEEKKRLLREMFALSGEEFSFGEGI